MAAALFTLPISSAQQQDPLSLNGGSVLAMAGDECVAVAVDRRFGSGPQVINVSPRTVLAPHPCLLVAFTGMEGDVQSLAAELSAQVSAKAGRSSGFGFGGEGGASGGWEGMAISPASMAALTGHVLYRRRRSPYYVEPIIAGLEKEIAEGEAESECGSHGDKEDRKEEAGGRDKFPSNCRKKNRIVYRPFLCAQDVIGAQSCSSAFVCSGAASKSLHGTAEVLWRPNLPPEKLVRVCGRAFLSALERDCLSGYGAIVYVVSRDGIVEYDLASRND